MRLRVVLLLAVLNVILISSMTTAQAQEGKIVLSLLVPEFMEDMFSGELLSQFEAENPGMKVRLVTEGNAFLPPAYNDVESHLEEVQDYVSAADVQYINVNTLSVEATRAGYFLNLAPLTSGDPALNVEDFFPAVWESFQWDGGVWAVPVSTDVITLTYDPAAFDAAGIPYPTDQWTLDDLANAARALARKDADGRVTSPGLVTSGNLGTLFRSLLGEALVDNSTIPNSPRFANPALESLLTQWAELIDEGIVDGEFTGSIIDLPLTITGSFGLTPFRGTQESQRSGVLLPGGKAGLSVQGFAVSSGTRYPEQAYVLARFLSKSAIAANNPFGVRPARQSLVGIQPVTSDDGAGFVAFRNFSPEVQALIDRAITSGLSVAEQRFTDYLNLALQKMRSDGLDAHAALQEVEAQLVSNLQTAADKHATTFITVATPPPDVELAAGEIALDFGMASFVSPLPNRDQWQQLIQEFVASDPQVGQINFDTDFGTADQFAATYDCFYLSYNAVPGLDLQTVLNLDPFMDADTSFDKADVVGNTLAQLQRDNKTWAFPIVIQPQVMNYHSEKFAQSGVPAPENGWTIDSFSDALRSLKVSQGEDAPFVPQDPGGSYLLMLIAAYGGIPLDYRTNPPTVNFTDPTTVEAIRQVLDLAKEGYIKYDKLASGAFVIAIGGPDQERTIYTTTLNGFNMRIGGNQDTTNTPYRMTTFPTGRQYSAVSYGIGTAYISATSQNPDACYRWISFLSRHPELFSAMPARRSLINDPVVMASQGNDVVSTYNQIDALLQQTNTITFPSAFAGQGSSQSDYLLQFWLNRAFDRYVTEDADLEEQLAEAELYARTFQECAASIPPFDPAVQDVRTYQTQVMSCATTADPSIAALFPALPR